MIFSPVLMTRKHSLTRGEYKRLVSSKTLVMMNTFMDNRQGTWNNILKVKSLPGHLFAPQLKIIETILVSCSSEFAL